MANYASRSANFFLLILILFTAKSAEAIRNNLYEINNNVQNSISRVSKDVDICKSSVESRGYICERHEVTTKDGFVLGMQRIPVGRTGKTADKPPVLLQHGIFTDATTWMFDSLEESLAFNLADNGFDVWLANARGTSSSNRHMSLGPNDPGYWDWSWDELVAYDLPAFVEYVHNQTTQKLHYVGHSLGTLMALAAFSQDKLVNMTRSAALLSPIAFMGNVPSPIAQAIARVFIAEELYWLGIRKFVPQGQQSSQLLDRICNSLGIDCSDLLLSSITGPNCCVNNSKSDVPLEPTATKNMIHLSQMIRTGSIKMYDYGNGLVNMQRYGQITPPICDMSFVPNDIPLFISYGGNDKLSDKFDVKILLDKLKDHDRDKLVLQFIENYAHLDFVRGLNAKKVVYDPLIDFFKLH